VTMQHVGRTKNRGLIPRTDKRRYSFCSVKTGPEVHPVFLPHGRTQTVIAGEEVF